MHKKKLQGIGCISQIILKYTPTVYPVIDANLSSFDLEYVPFEGFMLKSEVASVVAQELIESSTERIKTNKSW